MPKEKSVNPAQAQRKAEKAKAIKKGKEQNQVRKNEKLAKRNPDRLQKQLDDLKAVETSGGSLTSHEKTLVEGLEKEIKAVKRARDTLGDAAPKFGSGPRRDRDGEDRGSGARGGKGGGVLGKRRRDDEEDSESDVPDDVKSIPMPRDTPPPIPKEVLDKWYQARRDRLGITRNTESRGTSANSMPLGSNERRVGLGHGQAHGRDGIPDVSEKREKPKVDAQIVYESKPVVRDLRKEAVAFVPAAVRVKLEKGKGLGGLVEPEEADLLEKAGYMKAGQQGASSSSVDALGPGKVMLEEVSDEDG